MKEQSLGMMIAALRKEKGMTQLELAEKLGVTDKAVSKWERDLSCPDIGSIPKLSELLGVSVEELLQCKRATGDAGRQTQAAALAELIFKCVALAMGVAVAVLSVLNQLDAKSAVGMLGIGLACLAMWAMQKKGE